MTANFAKSGEYLPRPGCGQTPHQVGRFRAKSGQSLPRAALIWSNPAPVWSIAGQFWQSARVRPASPPIWPMLGPTSTKCGRCGPETSVRVRYGHKVGRETGPDSGADVGPCFFDQHIGTHTHTSTERFGLMRWPTRGRIRPHLGSFRVAGAAAIHGCRHRPRARRSPIGRRNPQGRRGLLGRGWSRPGSMRWPEDSGPMRPMGSKERAKPSVGPQGPRRSPDIRELPPGGSNFGPSRQHRSEFGRSGQSFADV